MEVYRARITATRKYIEAAATITQKANISFITHVDGSNDWQQQADLSGSCLVSILLVVLLDPVTLSVPVGVCDSSDSKFDLQR
jgi:hypothetical protein